MGMRYAKLFALLKEHGYTTYKIRKEGLIGQATLQKLQNDTGIIDTRTIEKICHALHCQPGDIMEYVETDLAADAEQEEVSLMAPLPKEQHYSYADLLAWDDNTRYELYDGAPVALASPSNIHQEVCMAISAQIYNYLLGKKCKVYPAPFDVRLFEEKDDTPKDVSMVVQPDISVVCDSSKTDGHGCKGAPDMVIEVTSPSTARYDKLLKFNLYQRAGVREYWIVDSAARVVSTYTLENGKYQAAAYGADSSIRVGVLDDCTIDLSTVFPEA